MSKSKLTNGTPHKNVCPTITIDKDALRFEFVDGDLDNIFWDCLFIGDSRPSVQTQIMRLLHRAYDECVKNANDNE